MLGIAALDRIVHRAAHLVFGQPFPRKVAVLHVGENLLHFRSRLLGYHPPPARQVAKLRSIRNRRAHVGNAALVDQIDDQLDLVQTLEISDLGLVASLDERIKPRADQLGQPAAQHHLLAEQVGLGLLAEGRLNDSGPAAANPLGIGQADLVRAASGVLVHCQQTRHATPLLVHAAHQVSRPFGRDHEYIDIRRRHYLPKVDVKPVGKGKGIARFEIGANIGFVHSLLDLVVDQDHHDVPPLAGLGHVGYF